jgi:hypothetical protein
VRDRRKANRGIGARVAGAAGWLTLRLCARVVRRPVDSVAILLAVATTTLIIVNAIFLQSGSRTAPFFANPTSQARSGEIRPKPAGQVLAKAAPPIIPARSEDPIAELIGPSPRILAIQRILSEYGYGQIKASGVLDDATSTAIERFEHDHKLPVTGQVSDRLVSELTAMTGHAMQ